MIVAGVMSGTSLDGIDAVAVDFADDGGMRVVGQTSLPMPSALRSELLALALGTDHEIERMGDASVALAHLYAWTLQDLQQRLSEPIAAAGVHGQTIRHRPERGFTLQLNHPALVAELSGIDIIADFRSRDVAAGGEGAPLVPAFHAACFRSAECSTAVLNIGGIANFTLIPQDFAADVLGFDCGPGNMLLDHWMQTAQGLPYDSDGSYARSGSIDQALLALMLTDPYFDRPIPKSTGREYFSPSWLDEKLHASGEFHRAADMPDERRRSIAAVLTELTARSAVDALIRWLPDVQRLYLCGGGALNSFLCERIRIALDAAGSHCVALCSTAACGIDPMAVEGAAFAWLAHQWFLKQPGNLPAATHAAGPRRLGCLYPAS